MERTRLGAGIATHLDCVSGEVLRAVTCTKLSDCTAGCSPLWLESDRYTILEDGLTPYRKLRGREYSRAVAEFGETVLFNLHRMSHKFPRRCEKVLRLGMMASTDEHILGTIAER